jgi:sugar phosphate isomerase/epimerase
MSIRIGLIGIVGEDLKNDFWGSMEKIAAIGYRGIESGTSLPDLAGAAPGEIRRRLDDLGLGILAFHTQKFRLQEHGEGHTLDLAAEVGSPLVTLSWGPVEDVEQLKKDAELYNRIGAACQTRGLKLAYHNHDHEFACFDGQTALDILLSEADPEMLHLHLDVAWTVFGGADPAKVIGRYAGRVPALHAKDLQGLEPGCQSAQGDRKAARFVEVGDGIVDFPAIIAAAREAGVTTISVEQDRPAELSPWQSVERSYANLAGLLGA